MYRASIKQCCVSLCLLAMLGCDDGDTSQGQDAQEPPSAGDISEDTNNHHPPADIGNQPPPGDVTPPDDTNSSVETTWFQNVRPLVAANCQPCHYEGGPASFSMETYDTTKVWAPVMASHAENKVMPPWPADDTEECQITAPLQSDLRLSDDEVALLRDWSDAGAPEGDANNAAPFTVRTPKKLDKVSKSLSLADYNMSWSVTAGQSNDDYRCFSIDLGLTEEKWLNGVEVIPGSEPGKRSIVHHLLVFLDEDGVSADVETDPGGSYRCVGGAGIPNSAIVAGWVPGMDPFETPEDSGVRLKPGGRIVLQMHYHPLGEETTDGNTTVNLRFTDGVPDLIAEIRIFGAVKSAPNLEPGPNDDGDVKFFIPKDAVDHTETMRIPLPVPANSNVRIWGVLPHMHYVGTDIIAKLERDKSVAPAGAEDECLIQTPRWDFNYQYFYRYDVPLEDAPKAHPGDTIMLRCTYNNNMQKNNKLALAIAQDPIIDETTDVMVGEETLDEMCAVLLGIAYPAAGAK